MKVAPMSIAVMFIECVHCRAIQPNTERSTELRKLIMPTLHKGLLFLLQAGDCQEYDFAFNPLCFFVPSFLDFFTFASTNH